MLGFAGLLLGMFSIGFMQLILATALPLITAELGGGSLYGWVFSSYMLATLAAIPLFSKLADIYGKKRFYFLGTAIFALGSLYGGLASGMAQLIAARVIQGLGAGIITPVALAMVTDMFPAEKRGNMIGIFGFVQLLANLLSPPLGSIITRQLGWLWIFFINFGLISLAGFLVALGEKEKNPERNLGKRPELNPAKAKVDVAGSLMFGGFCVLTVSLSNQISKQGLNILSFILLTAIILTAVMLVFWEKHHQSPVIKVVFFQTKIIRSSIISSVLAGGIMYGLVTILPLCGLILHDQGYKLDESKILLLFMIGTTVGLLTASRIAEKFLRGKLPRVLWLILSVCSVLMLYTLSKGNYLVFSLFIIIMGLGTGGIMATFLINSQNAILNEDRTVLSGLIQLGRYFGASLGITLLTGMLPEVGTISTTGQFTGAFGLLTALCTVGLINEFL